MDDEAQQRYNRLQKQSWIAYYLGRGRRSGWASYIGTDSAVCSFPVQHSEIDTVLTRPPGVRPRRRPGRWDKCDWSASRGAQRQSAPYFTIFIQQKVIRFVISTAADLPSTIYPHTWRGIRGYKVIPEVAAYTQSH